MEWFVRAFIKASLVWLGLGVTLGVAMAAQPAWGVYRPAHVHMNLLGFVTMMMYGVAYHVLPRFSGHPLYRRGLAGLHWTLANLNAPSPPQGSFDAAAAARGQQVFNGSGQCVTCHAGPLFTDANSRLHPPADVVSEPEPNGVPSYASRSATKLYRTAPLHGVWQHPPYFHNGIAATLDAVVELYDLRKGLHLTADQKADLVQYLKSL